MVHGLKRLRAAKSAKRPVAWLFLMSVALAAAPTDAAVGPTRVTVIAVIDGDTLALAGDHTLRLAGIIGPKPTDRNPDAVALAEAARTALSALATGREFTLTYGPQGQDRHGRLLAHASDSVGNWLQGKMLALGLAMVMTDPDNRMHATDMLRIEAAARRSGRGLWASRHYGVVSAAEAHRLIDHFRIVDGTVISIARVRGRVYLNFGADWRDDFTVALDQRLWRALVRDMAGATERPLEGRRLRVRGWLRSHNGPLIEATHLEQFELVDP